jgi:hypothetical protein
MIERIARYLNRWFGWPRDRCTRCQGERGGVRGNENWVRGELLCDYCHADDMLAQRLHASSRFMGGITL